MIIREIDREECYRVLARTRLARLACSHENQPYIVPVYLTFHHPSGEDPFLYGFSTLGQKIAWMRANPSVCVEVDEIKSSDDWVSVVVLGRFKELPDAPKEDPEQIKAWEILRSQPEWWEPGASAHVAQSQREPAQAISPVFYRISVEQVTGHKVFRDAWKDVAGATRT
jgi:nitroimidazol reductase NimA-like FMN-containing flavoprotein (pyridoxamine 5'-phosphate oxidase superfamily)